MFKGFYHLTAFCLALVLSGCLDEVQLSTHSHSSHASSATLPTLSLDDQEGQYQLVQEFKKRKDLVAAMKWLSVCAGAGHQPCVKELGYAYLQGEGVEHNPSLGLELLEGGLKQKDPATMNDLAWYFATSSSSDVYNPEKAMKILSNLQQKYGLNAMTADTLAAIQASQGLFQLAAQTQKKALNMLLRQGRIGTSVLSGYRTRLKLYRNGLAYRE